MGSNEEAKNNGQNHLKADENSNIAVKGSSQQTDPNNPKGHDPEVKKTEATPKKKKKKCLLL